MFFLVHKWPGFHFDLKYGPPSRGTDYTEILHFNHQESLDWNMGLAQTELRKSRAKTTDSLPSSSKCPAHLLVLGPMGV